MEESKQETALEVIKHSAAIQISSRITLLQRRAWNVLLAHAYHELPTEETHDIRVIDLIGRLEFDSKNEEYLKSALKALVGCLVEWNVLNKNGEWEWGVAGLLAGARIVGGICTYSFEPTLRKRLHNPSMYARLNLSLQNHFESKYAHALWEVCTDYLGSGRDNGATPFIPLEGFRKLIAVDDSYHDFKKLNQKVIKPAIAEVNRISDFQVEVEHQRKGRKVVALKFKMQRVKMLGVISKQRDLFPDLQDTPLVVKLLKEVGLSSNDAWDVWQKGVDYIEADDKPATEAFEAYIQEKIDLLKHRQQAGKVESTAGFLLSAIKHNYVPGKATQTISKRRRAKQTQIQAERQAALRERFAEHREQVFWQRFGERSEAWQAERRQRFEAMIQDNPIHRFVWQSYREHGSLQAPSVAGVFMQMLASELLTQPEETSLEAFAAWADEAA